MPLNWLGVCAGGAVKCLVLSIGLCVSRFHNPSACLQTNIEEITNKRTLDDPPLFFKWFMRLWSSESTERITKIYAQRNIMILLHKYNFHHRDVCPEWVTNKPAGSKDLNHVATSLPNLINTLVTKYGNIYKIMLMLWIINYLCFLKTAQKMR